MEISFTQIYAIGFVFIVFYSTWIVKRDGLVKTVAEKYKHDRPTAKLVVLGTIFLIAICWPLSVPLGLIYKNI